MNRGNVISQLSQMMEISKSEAERTLNAFQAILTEAFVRGEDVKLVDFANLRVVRREQGKGRNPRTGEEMIIPARQVVKFVMSEKLKNEMNPS